MSEAFRELQAGRAERALELARAALAKSPADARAQLAEGIALRMLGRHDEALQALERARSLEPASFAAQFAAGSLRYDRGDWNGAAERFRIAHGLQPRQVEALKLLTRALQNAGKADEAERLFVAALAGDPHDANVLRAFGQFSVGQGNFRRAATLYAEALRALPDDDALPMYLAQAELLLGRWDNAWAAYGKRATRRQVERMLAAQGAEYRVPSLAALAGREVQVIAEQGYGDILFFLRWAPRLVEAGARLRFVGPAGLHALIARTGLFLSLHDFSARDVPASVPILAGDLPQVAGGDPLAIPSLRIAPDAARVDRWRERLEAAGPRPWVALTWRAGKPPGEIEHGLQKVVPVERLVAAANALGGSVIVLQRKPEAGEMERANRAAASPLADLSAANDDLEDALAVVSLVDRYFGVSNTNMHLAACAGTTADVLVPFPPEWRWRIEGDSPWFPGFRVHRQAADGSWDAAFASLAR